MKSIVQQALVGTAKQSSDKPLEHAVVALVNHRSDLTVERRLLLAAGAATLHDRAGYRSQSNVELPSPAAAEAKHACPPQAATIISDLLDRAISDEALLIEALELMHKRQLVLPAVLLPKALNVPNRRDFRSAIRRVVGERGQWLAQFNEDWLWAKHYVESNETVDQLPADANTIWEEAELNARLEILKLARNCKAAQSRDWIQKAWSSEKADVRQQLLSAFMANLTPDDLPVLEMAIKDRSSGVRTVAAQGLAQLPESALAERMRARAVRMLSYEKAAPAKGVLAKVATELGSRNSNGKLEIKPPAEFDKDWSQDGLEAKPPPGMGERAHWLTQIISLVPLDFWTNHFQTSTETLIAAGSDDDFGSVLMEAWVRSALRFGSNEWFAPLWDYWYAYHADERGSDVVHRADLIVDLLAAMSDEDRENRIRKLLDGGSRLTEIPLVLLLRNLPRPWSDSFAQDYLGWAGRLYAVQRDRSVRGDWRDTLEIARVGIPASCLEAAANAFPSPKLEADVDPSLGKVLDQFRHTIELRRRYHAALYE